MTPKEALQDEGTVRNNLFRDLDRTENDQGLKVGDKSQNLQIQRHF